MLSNNKIEHNQIKIEGIIYNIEDFRKIHPGGQHFSNFIYFLNH